MKPEIIEKIRKLVKDSYAAIAADFDISRRKEIWPEAHRYVSLIPSGARVLDAGCGNGRLLSALNGNQIDYLGIDGSNELVVLAKENYPEFNFQTMDILDTQDLPDSYYDFIFCLAVIPHLPSADLRLRALQNLSSKLKADGQIIVSAWDLYGYHKFRPLLRKAAWAKLLGHSQLDYGDLIFPWKNAQGQVTSERYYHAFKEKEIFALFKAADLKIKDFSKQGGNYWVMAGK
ncbi:MAG: class I SAM-dependent methyltransferase [Patescibacteria group bacterium]|jgi:2-polyprenyl-3-methyl-5-hydroxy-6-metoxy-1,4-benzoquinol methylase